ncbi:hypothetical protein LIER_40036 [Lithospermum erythrorhizon]|uniref:Uncharacterized protein n=1 Tax=Lithospermum erythrorhizon TaxID=34254 RepID=A0AAV3QPL0_LITER
MAMLQRSSKSFRRQGSSGLVWDDKSSPAEIRRLIMEGKPEHGELKHSQSCNLSFNAPGNEVVYRRSSSESSVMFFKNIPLPKVFGSRLSAKHSGKHNGNGTKFKPGCLS